MGAFPCRSMTGPWSKPVNNTDGKMDSLALVREHFGNSIRSKRL